MPTGPDPSSDGLTVREWLVPLCCAAVLAFIGLRVLVGPPVPLLGRLIIIAVLAVPGLLLGLQASRLLRARRSRHVMAVLDGQVTARAPGWFSSSPGDW